MSEDGVKITREIVEEIEVFRVRDMGKLRGVYLLAKYWKNPESDDYTEALEHIDRQIANQLKRTDRTIKLMIRRQFIRCPVKIEREGSP